MVTAEEDGSVDVTPAKDGGVLKRVVKEGSGDTTPAKGCNVYVHYTGKLTDGSVFDSSRDRGTPFDFQLGKGKVIRGWDIGVATMKIGEVSVLTIREDYGYGKSGSQPKIPGGATLIFEIELLDWEPEDLSGKKDKGILRYPITNGTNFESPKPMAEVEIHLKGEYEGKAFDDRDVSFMLGTGSSLDVPPGVEKALEHFTLNETSRLVLTPKYAFGSVGCKNLNLPPDASPTYTVTLKSFQKIKDRWLMDPEELLSEGRRLKEKGTEYLKKSDVKLALKMYKHMVKNLDSPLTDGDGEDEKERKALLAAGHSNISLCNLKLNRPRDAIHSCNSVLEIDEKNEKAFFRRGQAYLAVGEPENAKKDFEMVVKLEPNNKAASAAILQCTKMQKELKEREKKMYAHMFEKFAQKDREWRFGWLEGEKPMVEMAPDNPELAAEKRKQIEAKKKFLDEAARRLREKREAEASAGGHEGGEEAAEPPEGENNTNAT
ncbi:peptidyl-prolyl cis-trans isomerase FKBP4 isoform X1 [Cimex lectularius]|uniref:peptidylprolyl isomerase n=1 Tax=Cimex lectularius TaxID=79782 RepID=A0A8I6S7R0_CIMLE|nr:peptidyl-prolyl cis-trans isomerase FKBP4 isoform X1 [Cimex lectularius]XP_014258451.1 peptidyl-prolyl cis-trans isomerase FKBP4 isoform X1 [Cimex lectularius]